jgi:hypothetical protein
LARITEETVTCFGCGNTFERVAVVDLDPGRDAALLNDDSAMLAISAIKCPRCAYEELRPVQVLRSVQYHSAENETRRFPRLGA